MIERIMIAGIVAALIAGLYFTSTGPSEAERERAQYCEMVDAWHDTGGEIGWPPYDGECDNEQ